MDLKGSQQNKNNCVTPSCHKSTICGYEDDEDMKIRNKKKCYNLVPDFSLCLSVLAPVDGFLHLTAVG